ncbi:hypothetical protein F5J12DRAFT_894146 [Pisolithus orientalis]|uniref:uncharacterized protein n=1 Tax=Pisolithus orientalis TaxID=936130 RepID=UPI002224DA5C|nr:uncharacterized protein F5J12DRAFT_894146 [Pisolithus orientalis]KAI6002386.1 hypothetical protein F5J12DRAFT_894146 [Pisolithus orientalis]
MSYDSTQNPTQNPSRNPDPSVTDRDVPSGPQHRLHDPNQPLPRREGREGENFERAPESCGGRPTTARERVWWNGVGAERGEDYLQGAGAGRNAYTTDRPLGAALRLAASLTSTPARLGVTDKIFGKTEKVVGKMTNNPEMHERGELREAGGRAAAEGHARAPHD